MRAIAGPIWVALAASRVVLLAIVTAVLLLRSGQGAELVASLLVLPTYNNWLLFFAVFVWAGQSWIWAHLAISLALSKRSDGSLDPVRIESIVLTVLPAIFALAIFALALYQFIVARKAGLVPLIGVCGLSLFAGLLASFYTAGLHSRSTPAETAGGRPGPYLRIISYVFDVGPGELRDHAVWWSVFVPGSIVLSLASFGAGVLYPSAIGANFGTMGVVFLGLGVFVSLLSPITIATRKARFPTLLFVVFLPSILQAVYGRLVAPPGWMSWLAVAVLGLAGLLLLRRRSLVAGALVLGLAAPLALLQYTGLGFANGVPHAIRNLSPDKAWFACDSSLFNPESCSRRLDNEVDHWLAGVGSEGDDGPQYMVFVAAAGGGLRAAYWTASILTRLGDCAPQFNDRLVAISGVSGGSMGAAVYAALLGDLRSADRSRISASRQSSQPNCDQYPLTVADVPLSKGWMQAQLGDVLRKDFLAPSVTGLLFGDLFQSVLPVRFLDDRSATFEKALEDSWRSACEKRSFEQACVNSDAFAASFFDLRKRQLEKGGDWIPLLLLNGTHQETGKRVITSDILIDPVVFSDAYGFFYLAKHDVALSTAVLNSSRFPIVSPPGAILQPQTATPVEPVDDTRIRFAGHVIDGGFFENNGAITLQEAATAILSRVRKIIPGIRPLVIELLNDVGIGEADLQRRREGVFEPPGTRPLLWQAESNRPAFANDLLSTLHGLLETRSARGVLASKALGEFVKSNKGVFVQFRLCPHMSPSPPLGWLLTQESTRAMDELLLGMTRQGFHRTLSDLQSRQGDVEGYLSCFSETQQQLAEVISLLRGVAVPAHLARAARRARDQ